MEDIRRSYIDASTGEMLFLEWGRNEGWTPSLATMFAWQSGRLRIYAPADNNTTLITMPGFRRWALIQTDSERANVREVLEHPWIPDGQATEGLLEEEIEELDALQLLMADEDAHLSDTQLQNPLLDTILRPTLLMELPMTLLTLNPLPAPSSQPTPFPPHLGGHMLEKAELDGQTCPITMEPIKKTDAAITSCGHIFQKQAIAEWMQTHDTCPECRQICSL